MRSWIIKPARAEAVWLVLQMVTMTLIKYVSDEKVDEAEARIH